MIDLPLMSDWIKKVARKFISFRYQGEDRRLMSYDHGNVTCNLSFRYFKELGPQLEVTHCWSFGYFRELAKIQAGEISTLTGNFN